MGSKDSFIKYYNFLVKSKDSLYNSVSKSRDTIDTRLVIYCLLENLVVFSNISEINTGIMISQLNE